MSIAQPIPTVTTADIERIVRRDFAADERTGVLNLLHAFSSQADLDGPQRILAAALKLAGGSIERLQAQLQVARIDYRDVVAQAEYRRYMNYPAPVEASEEIECIVADDWAEYVAWFTRG